MKRLRMWSGLFLCLTVFGLGGVIPLLAATTPVQAQGGPGRSAPPLPAKPTGKLSARLTLLAHPSLSAQDAETQARTLGLPAAGPGSLLRNGEGAPLIYIRLTDTSAANLAAITAAGAAIVHVAPAYRTATAYVPVERLRAVAGVEAVENMQEEVRPSTAGAGSDQPVASVGLSALPQAQVNCPGAVTSEGYQQLKVNLISPTLTGAGVTVGVLSDSFAQLITPTRFISDVMSGDLPGSSNPCNRKQTVKVIADYDGSKSIKDEGRAMAQIVHDLAPGAKIVFSTAFQGIFMYAGAVRQLRDPSGQDGGAADIIVDDILYEQQPFFQDGPVSVAIRDVVADGAVYFTAAGNNHETITGRAAGSYEAPAYRPMPCPTLRKNGQAVSGLGMDCHDFDPEAANEDAVMAFTLAPNGVVAINFQWAEPWYGVGTDLDIYLIDPDNNNEILKSSVDTNIGPTGTQKPWELVQYENGGASAKTVELVIVRFRGGAAPRLKYILTTSANLSAVEYTAANSTDSFGPTIFGHPGAGEAISLAAVPYDDPHTVRASSSRGFPTYYYGPVVNTNPAALLPVPQTRLKPDVAATNDVCNTFFGYAVSDTTCSTYRFAGTSAAAPHAAAVAALMKQRAARLKITLRPSEVEFILEETAAAIANASPRARGAGLINAAAAVGMVGNIERLLYLPVIYK